MTPKSLLRHPMAKSKTEDFVGEGHFFRILSDTKPAADKDTKKVILCSGKVFYDLAEARDENEIDDTQIIRLEQLYPFPGEPLALRLSRMPNLEEVVWCEEAAKEAGVKNPRPRYAGRNASASPATGLAKRHTAEQAALVADALHLSVRDELRRKQKA
jgi:2-oxoglutarate dehydrogenase E1 component